MSKLHGVNDTFDALFRRAEDGGTETELAALWAESLKAYEWSRIGACGLFAIEDEIEDHRSANDTRNLLRYAR